MGNRDPVLDMFKGKHPHGDWVGSWINELGVERRGWLEIQNLESSACSGTQVIYLDRIPQEASVGVEGGQDRALGNWSITGWEELI